MSIPNEERGLAREGASVRGVMNYLGEMEEMPFADEKNPKNSRMILDPHEIQFTDARPIADRLSLDVQGVKLIRHQTAMRDFHDPAELKAVYLREMEEVVQRQSGADRVISSIVPVLRLNDPANERAYQAGPLAHSDYTDFTLRTQLGHQVDLTAPEFCNYKRIVAYQTWRALSPPPQDSALAFCDPRSVNVRDRVLSKFTISIPRPEVLEFYIYRYSAAHRWFYFPDLHRDELLIFKGFEGDEADKMKLIHGAFAVSGCPEGTPKRESVETRSFAFFRE